MKIQVDYSRFLMNPSVVGMFHDWEAQYRTYVLQSLQNPIGIQAVLVLAISWRPSSFCATYRIPS